MSGSVKIAIHNRQGGYSARWIEYCDLNGIIYRVVNCYDNDILAQVADCDGLMWHWCHDDYRDLIFARQLIASIETMGVLVFPDLTTCWHYDDKVGQKYLLESINAPLIPSYTLYSREDALKWIKNTTFPKVFKLKAGAGSANVRLARNAKQARNLVKRAFGRGFHPVNPASMLNQRLWIMKRDRNIASFTHLLKGIGRLLLKDAKFELLPRQKGYAYFQDFIPDNSFDQRVLVIGNRAVSHRRYVRKNDFRASGSGLVHIEKEPSDIQAVEVAFKVSKALKTQCLAFDFIYDADKKPLIVEMSYASPTHVYDLTLGYWDSNLNWIEGTVNPQYFIIEDFIQSIEGHKRSQCKNS